MIRTVGIDSSNFKSVEPDYVLDYFSNRSSLQFDTETKGFDCHTAPIICFQVGDYDNQFVIHPKYLGYFKELLQEKELVGQNIKFDLKFLYKNNIFPKKVYDTFLAESVLYCGIQTRRKSLAALAKEWLDIDLDKSVRDNIWNKGLTDEVIEYAANDVKYLDAIREKQEFELAAKELRKALMVENSFVLSLAYIEFCGFKLDTAKWGEKSKSDRENFNLFKSKLDEYVISNGHINYIDLQGNLFSEGVTCSINWGSPKQVAEYFKFIGIPVSTDDGGESVGEKNIAKYQEDFPILKDYLSYKGYEKLIGTYGENFFNHVNPVTGRLHTNFKQVMDTGRISSGGKNRETGEDYINFQNIPSDKNTRSCFVAEEGNSLLISDYSGQEQVVLANYSLDKNILEFYDKGLADMHSFVASKMYKELEGMDLDDIKTQHKDKRQSAKSAGFAINYGGNGLTIARNNNLPIELGEQIYKSYFEAFPGLKDYFLKVQTQALNDGYVLISSRTGRKCYIQGYENFLERKKKFTKEFWTLYRKEKESNSEYFKALKEEVSKWFKFKGQIERMALNYPIQGSSAEITKISCIYFFEWIRREGLFNIVKIVNTVHDENVVECPDGILEKVSESLKKCMNDAALLYCKRVLLTAEPDASKYWRK